MQPAAGDPLRATTVPRRPVHGRPTTKYSYPGRLPGVKSKGTGLLAIRLAPVSQLSEGILGQLGEGRGRVEVSRLPEGGLGLVPPAPLGKRQPEPVVGRDHGGLELDGGPEGLLRLLRLAPPDVRLAHVV